MELLQILEQSPTLLLVATFTFSLLIGSFLNVVIYRLPKSMEYDWTNESISHLSDTFKELSKPLEKYSRLEKPASIIWARSNCQNCSHQIKAWENIPVLGFLFLRGKCSNCKTKISHRYWIIELLTAILSTLVVYQFGWSLAALSGVILTWFLISIAMIDYDTMVIPDQFSLPLMWLGLFISFWAVFIEPDAAIKGALLGYLLLWVIFHLFKLATGKDGMGYGDFKLLAAGGAWFGMQSVMVIVIMSSFAGAVIGSIFMFVNKNSKNKPIPFGPYLAIGIWLTMLYGQNIISWYLDFSGLS
ncbi:MAG: prepilin peptidase [Alcanivoracaceae bacterium]|nr:prepilin peptidase [Alcanivoracaceae bacterium]